MTSTAEVHRHIEQIAALTLDATAAVLDNPDAHQQITDLAAPLQAQFGAANRSLANPAVAEAIGAAADDMIYATPEGLTLAHAACAYVLYRSDRPAFTMCPHTSDGIAPVFATLRTITCHACALTLNVDGLDTDTTCDVCEADHGAVHPVIVTTVVTPALVAPVLLHVGRCCIELFDYVQSVDVDRNDPCPCRSGAKFGRCCGAAGSNR